MATDTITLAEQLESTGLEPKQAKEIARAIHDHQTEHLATKADLLVLKTELRAEMAELRAEMAEFRTELRFHRWTLALIVALVLAVLGKVW
ncbi:MAG: DUF1640 domain-containing protein [Nitrospira sp.]|nr:DUF1640 domain-containing protein [Nitrospira sp.]MCY4132779.1 DUF1640 domain-containing protein [Nitrospira sp.]